MTLLVIDVGSSSVRALLFDDDARPLAGAVRHIYRFETGSDGQAVVDASALRDLIETSIDEILKHPAAHTIQAVGMTTFVGNIVGLDARDRPLTPIYTYADTQSADDVDLLRPRVDVPAAHQRTGCLLHTAYLPPRLHWIRRTQPDLFGDVALWCDVATHCYRHWFGREVPCGYSVASWSGMLNRAGLGWDAEWLSVLDVSVDCLPPLADYTATQTGLSQSYAARWPALQDIPFYLAVGDGAAANIGSGGVDRDHPVLTVGTTAALRIVSDATLPEVPPGLWAYRVDAGRHLIGGATTEGGSIYHWALNTLKLDASAVEDELILRAPDLHGLTVLPLLAGERSPGWQGDATGTIHGLRLNTKPLDILHAMLESIALRLSLLLDSLNTGGVPVIAGGGALVRSPAWAQMMADAFGCPLHLLAEDEATARGVALLLRQAMTGQPPDPPRIGQVLKPRPEATAAYRAAGARQLELYRALYGD